MAWLKDVYLDVVILLFIVLYAITVNQVLEVVLWVYTALLILSKVLSLFMPSLQRKAGNTEAPILFYHIVYALSAGIFFYASNYYLAGAWLLVWVLSVINLSSLKEK
jgi:dolichol kinase